MVHSSGSNTTGVSVSDLNLANLDQQGNFLVDEEKGYASLRLDRGVYPLPAVQFAAHQLASDANFIIDSDKSQKIIVEIFLKDNLKSIKKFFWKFKESIIGHSVYLIQSERNRDLRETILKKALAVE